MGTERRPRVIGPDDLLALRGPLRERPAPLVYFSDREFARLIKGAVELPRRPRGPSLLVFEPWPSGGMVQSQCESPPGQVCFGRWTPAGPGRSGGAYFECVCTPTRKPERTIPCQAILGTNGTLQCAGDCEGTSECRPGLWKDRPAGEIVLACRCALPTLEVAARVRRARRRR
jgi:hypothetical protein